MSGNNSNINGAFERAKDQWNCALLQMTADLGRGAVNVLRVGNMMVMHSNRKEFYEHHQLVAFPGLDRLAFMLGLNEKTVRRARNKLVELGLIDTDITTVTIIFCGFRWWQGSIPRPVSIC